MLDFTFYKEINLNTGEGLSKRLLFPDNQPHVNVGTTVEVVDLTVSLIDSKRVLEMLMVSNAIKRRGGLISGLHIPYLMGARFDRIMEEGDSFDLEVIADLINSVEAGKVYLFDPHSDVAPALIKNSVIVSNRLLVAEYNQPDSVLLIPDAGAAKKAHKYMEWNKNIVDTVQCVKHRDLSTGAIDLKVLEPEKCLSRDCVIIDDLCDGGGTFLRIENQINPARLTLIVTHGIFSKGTAELSKRFHEVIVSNSYYSQREDTPKNFKIIDYVSGD